MRGGFKLPHESAQMRFKNDEEKLFYEKWKKELDEFARGDKKVNALELPPMKKEERKLLHQMARNKDLISISKGKEGSRYMTISAMKGFRYMSIGFNDIYTIRLHKDQLECVQKYMIENPIDEEQVHKHFQDPDISSRKNFNHSTNFGGMFVPRLPGTNIAPSIVKFRQDLPAYRQKNEILDAINSHQVVLITGGTGCGKTTQVPQFILEQAAQRRERIRIVCTQPRRLPAIAVAERVAKERGEELPGTVGYHIRLEQKYKPDETALIYCTSGVLSRMMAIDGSTRNISHVILDEIHERELNTDYLLIALREALKKNRNLKVILMSATMAGNTEIFMNYFRNFDIKSVNIPSRLFHVQTFHLGDVLALSSYLQASPEVEPAAAGSSFPQVEQWAHSNGMHSYNTVPDLGSYAHTMHPSASTPSFPDPITHIATQLTNSQTFARQSSLCNYNSATTTYDNGYDASTVAAPTAYETGYGTNGYEDYGQSTNGFYIESMNNGVAAAPTSNDLRRYDYNPTNALLSQLNAKIGPQPHYFVPDQVQNIMLNPFSRSTICEIYEGTYGRWYGKEIIDHDLATHVINFLMDSPIQGSILVFLPGYDDICNVRDRLNANPCTQHRAEIFTLHSQMNSSDQQRVFDAITEPGVRKVILSTNIAEASLTIEDVVFVIDSGRVKEKVYNHSSRISQLRTIWIARSNAEQRSGRAGRVRNGYCFRLYTDEQYNNMTLTQVAEMKRSAIHDVCLHAKMFAPKDMPVKTFLGNAPEPPDSVTIDSSFEFLQQLGAMFLFSDPNPLDLNAEPPSFSSQFRNDIEREPDITELGAIIAQLPLEPQLARMLLMGIVLQCFHPILTLVAALGHRDPFILPLGDEKSYAVNAKDTFAKGNYSDHLTLIRCLNEYAACNGKTRDFCRRNYLSHATMRMIYGIKFQLLGELKKLNLINQNCPGFDDLHLNKYSKSWAMVQAAIVGGCYPGIGITRSGNKIKRIRTSVDPDTTLHPSSVVKRQLQAASNRNTYFDETPEPSLEFLAFQELAQIDQGTTLRTVTATTPLHVILFAGSIRMEKITIQDYEIGSEEFPPDAKEGDDVQEFKREYNVELDNFIGFRGFYETIQLAMKLRFKFFNYFLKYLRNPTASMKQEDHRLLECLNMVLSFELKKLYFAEVNDLFKPMIRPYQNSNNSNHRNYPERNGNHFNQRSRENGFRQHIEFNQQNNSMQQNSLQPKPNIISTPSKPNNNSSTSKPNNNPSPGRNVATLSFKDETLSKQEEEPSSATRPKRRFTFLKSDPIVQLAVKTAAAASSSTSSTSTEQATKDLKSMVKSMQTNNVAAVEEPKKDAPPPKVDKSCTTISSSINTQETTSVIVPPSKQQVAAAVEKSNGHSNGDNKNSTPVRSLFS